MRRGEFWARNLKSKLWFRLWLFALSLFAVLAFFASSLMRYHWPIKPIFLFPDRVTQVKDYQLQSSYPFLIGPIDNFENRDRISKFEFNFNADTVKAAATIFEFGTNEAPIRLYVFNNQLKLLAPGGLKRNEVVQLLTLLDEIQPKKSYQVNFQIKNGTFIHIRVDGVQILDLDEPGLVTSGLLSIGSNLDGGQVFVGSINKIKIREGVKEFRTSKIFIPLFWILFFAVYWESIE